MKSLIDNETLLDVDRVKKIIELNGRCTSFPLVDKEMGKPNKCLDCLITPYICSSLDSQKLLTEARIKLVELTINIERFKSKEV